MPTKTITQLKREYYGAALGLTGSVLATKTMSELEQTFFSSAPGGSSGGFAYGGDGSDGAVVISTTVTLTRNMHYTDLTITSTGILKPDGWIIYGTGTLTVDSGGVIQMDGIDGIGNVNGGPQGSNQRALGFGGGAANGNANTTVGNNAPALTGVASSLGGASGNGGASGGGFAGGAGVSAGIGTTWGAVPYMNAWRNPNARATGYASAIQNNTFVSAGIAGGPGGGGGASDGNGGAGGGGGGGGVVVINFGKVTNNGRISSNGGKGGNALSNNAGGGGGGGAGVVFINTKSFTGTQPQALGGAGGNGTGTGLAGVAGGNGTASVWTVV